MGHSFRQLLSTGEMIANENAMKPELIIFDCDGVLIDSEIIACGADAIELSKIGYPISTEEVVRRFSGVPSNAMYAEIEADLGHALPDDFEHRVVQRVHHEYRNSLRAIPNVRETVEQLTTPFCVASSSKPEKLRLGLERTGLLSLFEPYVFSATQVERGKPHPDIFLFAAAQFGAPAQACVVIEDSVAGITAARAAKMRTVGFVGASHCAPGHDAVLREAGAEVVLGRLSELMASINALPELT